MAQDPLQIDALQVEPGSGQTLTIERDAATGSLKFTDNVANSGVNLNQLAGLRSIPNVYVVGGSGLGAEYTTIQDALDAVPSNASAINPYLILVMPGRYTETVNIVRDGVILIGMGEVILRSALDATPDAAGADHTLIISAQLGTIPLTTHIENLTIQNAHTNKACVRVVGGAASTVGSNRITLRNCNFQPTQAGGNYYLWATAVNHILVDGGYWGTLGAPTQAEMMLIQEVALLDVVGVRNLVGALDLRYDTVQDVPSETALGYYFTGCPDLGTDTLLAPAVGVDLDGAGDAVFQNCVLGAPTISGDQAVAFRNCQMENLTVSETVAATLYSSNRGTLNTNALAVLDEPLKAGTEAFAAAATATVTFGIPMSDTNYSVALEVDAQPTNDETPWITAKAVSGFTINFNTAQTLSVRWNVTRTNV